MYVLEYLVKYAIWQRPTKSIPGFGFQNVPMVMAFDSFLPRWLTYRQLREYCKV
ncbi:hypothetical protein T4A_14504 [Trichinella pseudospiralis]|uniref:Uncharacterized protein n=1 Tax=Trichinella pseudospiralis TaxID=6337 RepID=A0A0V1EKX8_TRIPS|nr:hypothetical protein T4A_14504 [Trichinella pseudospiralis]